MTYHFRAFVLGLAILTLAIFICVNTHTSRAAVNYPVAVEFPKQYTYDDGTVLAPDQFTGTKVMYGTCSPETEIADLLGEVMVPSTKTSTGTFNVPSGQMLCFVAVVLDLEGQPMGRSYVVKYSTVGKIPSRPVNVFAQ
jgi:hypothetical protein